MAKLWRRKNLIEDDDEEDNDDEEIEERYKRPKIETRRFDPAILGDFSDGYDDFDEDEYDNVDELLEKVKKGKYKPKKNDHWSLHVAYALIQNRGR